MITVGVTGTWQQDVVADAASVVAVPDRMTASTAAQVVTNPLTALLLVTREFELRPGEWLLQTAAGSTVGKLLLQLAGHLGFATINVVRRRPAVPEILELGGTEVICTEDEDCARAWRRSLVRGASAKRSSASPARAAPTCRARSPRAARWSSTAPSRPTARPRPTGSRSRGTHAR